MYLDNNAIDGYIGTHPHLTLSCTAKIDERYEFLFLRLMSELKQLSQDESQIHVFYIDTDAVTGIPTPHVEILGSAPVGYDGLCDRYEDLYQRARRANDAKC